MPKADPQRGHLKGAEVATGESDALPFDSAVAAGSSAWGSSKVKRQSGQNTAASNRTFSEGVIPSAGVAGESIA
jgi:hypothetical protein